jgi:hypothetical protein
MVSEKTRTGYLSLAVLVTWTGIGLQAYLFHEWALSHHMGPVVSVLNFLSFFTNLANVLAGTMLLYALSCALSRKPSGIDAKRITDTAVYLCMAGIVFNLELKHLLPADNLVYLTNMILHDVSPLLFLAYWWLDCPSRELQFRQMYTCLLFPMLYFVYMLTFGHFTGRYPYPFFDVAKIGYVPVVQTGLQMLAGFLVVSMSLVMLNRLKLPTTTR